MEITDVVKRAVWWPANDIAEADSDEWSPVAPPAGTRKMHGEIVLKDLKPTMALAHFSVEVSERAVSPRLRLSDANCDLDDRDDDDNDELQPREVAAGGRAAARGDRDPARPGPAPPTYDGNEAHSVDDEGTRGDVRDKQKWVYGLGKGA